ncbi:methyltransferase [Xylariaceae sp. FL0662B]|nr:methyltransferase [Xylariaceae sp. FL0662B]
MASTAAATNPTVVTGEVLADAASSLTLQDTSKAQLPPHRNHDPQYNMKRSDPFQFGSRYLEEGDDVFEFNAWDHVETDDTYKEYAEQQYAMQRESPVSDFDKHRFNSDPAKWWNLFYKNNTANFFKNRKWLQQEFPILDKVTKEDAGPITILEVGAGAGNTAFPILANNKNPKLKIHACDFSKKAVDVMRSHEAYNTDFMQADVWDAAGQDLPPGLVEGTVDVVLMVFIFSALSPSQWGKGVQNVHRLLKPGGEVCFRDYGRGDLAQVRFKKGRYLEENFYIRGDGTRVYFFEKDELARIWAGPSSMLTNESTDAGEAADTADISVTKEALFDVEELGIDRRMLVNRARRLKMYRCWIQGRFRKK